MNVQPEYRRCVRCIMDTTVDYKNHRGKPTVFTHGASRRTDLDPVGASQRLVESGVGEIFLNSVDRDGTMTGFDLECIQSVAKAIPVPLLACGGAHSMNDLRSALASGASAVAAGSMFVFHGRHRAVLITYPRREEIAGIMPSFGTLD